MTIRSPSPHAAVAFLLLGPTFGTAQVVHREHTFWNHSPVTNATLDARLATAASAYRRYAPVPRVALFDAAYPKDCDEFAAMTGYGVFVVIAVAQDSTELPPARVFAVVAGAETPFPQVEGIQSHVAPTDTMVRATFGTYRFDAIHLFPVAAGGANADVLLDFAAHRRGFRLGRLMGPASAALRACPAPPPGSQLPPPEAIRALVRREYPDLGRTLEPEK
jgi:hypothetical protein